ncbi:helix-turn-helix domain-containing protein [Levilinea saccharolytica]|uniref:Helix-turn-helix domain-containing protein n=1 Tax=Levilinea saccharolytica TaxID=229921 RepID=A0A0P6Y9J3_9CHLR|nr:helix-turn-helix domain-containing protein [Levilinea saccharolytica]KPL78448.1 hypothetical protein ADN01_14665 [Levilinea saccharolytica]GAP18529.1 protein containing DNA binding domain, excisionase family [Levilinea saccharolytica]
MTDRNDPREYLKINEAAQFLGVNPRTVYRHIKTGKIPASMVGGLYLIRRSDLEAVLSESRLDQRAEVTPLHPVLRCGSCYSILISESQIAATCAAESCEEILCASCKIEGKRFCARHQPSAQDRLQTALQALARGEIPLVVRSGEARLREINFTERILTRLTGITTLIHPLDGSVITIQNWQTCLEQGDHRADVMRLLNKVFLDSQTIAQMPLNAWFTARPPQPKGTDGPPVEIQVNTISRLQAHANNGFDSYPLDSQDLQAWLSRQIEEANTEQCFRLILLASTTGWDPSARRMIAASEQPGQAFVARRLLVYLFDLENGDLIYNEKDDRARIYAELFVPLLESEQIAEAVRAINNELLVYDSLTLEQAGRTLPFSKSVLKLAFQRMAQGDTYSIMEIPRLGMALIRN